MPTLLNLVPNSAKVMATSGVAVIRLILRVSSYEKTILYILLFSLIFTCISALSSHYNK